MATNSNSRTPKTPGTEKETKPTKQNVGSKTNKEHMPDRESNPATTPKTDMPSKAGTPGRGAR